MWPMRQERIHQMNVHLTPTERLVLYALSFMPNRTAGQLASLTGTKTLKYMHRALRTLCLAKLITFAVDEQGETTYNVVPTEGVQA
jgi:DNA-binding MarR family transcriptional regulator